MSNLLEQLKQLAPLSAAATAAPWRHEGRKGIDMDHKVHLSDGATIVVGDAMYHDSHLAAFIAAARNLLTPENLTLLTAALVAPQWVAVTDRLPAEDKHHASDYVLGYEPHGGNHSLVMPIGMLMCYYRFLTSSWHEAEDGRRMEDITHWMPLPPTPPPTPAA